MLEGRIWSGAVSRCSLLVFFPALQHQPEQLSLIKFLELEMMKLKLSCMFLTQAKHFSGSGVHRNTWKGKKNPASQLLKLLNGRLAFGCLKSLLCGVSENGSYAASKPNMWIIRRPWWLQLCCSYSNRSVMLVLEERQSLREGSAEMQAHALAGLDTFSGWWGIKNGSRLLTELTGGLQKYRIAVEKSRY